MEVIDKLDNLNIIDAKKEIKLIDNLTFIHKGILLFLLIISGNYIGNLFSCRIQDFFDSSIYAKHSIGLISLYFFVMLAEPKLQEINPLITLLLAIPLYFYFLILAKSEASIFLLILVLLIILMILHTYNIYLDSQERKNKNKSFIEKKYAEYSDLIKKILIGVILIITIIGFLTYLGMKKIEYGKKFNMVKFMFGSVKCNHNYLGEHPHLSQFSESITNHKLNLGVILLFIKKAFS